VNWLDTFNEPAVLVASLCIRGRNTLSAQAWGERWQATQPGGEALSWSPRRSAAEA